MPNPTARPGEVIKGDVHVYASGAKAQNTKLALSADTGVGLTPTCTKAGASCNLGEVTAKGDFVPVKLKIPASASGTIRITTTVSSKTAAPRTVVHLLSVASATPSPASTVPPSTAPTLPNAVMPQNNATSPILPNSTVPTSATGTVLPPIDPNTQQPVTASGQPTATYQNVAAIRPADPADAPLSNLARLQAAWLAALFALFGFLFLQARKPTTPPPTHRRP
ncbi:hypothetical protein, partial [Actinocorallia lasiicapitis]